MCTYMQCLCVCVDLWPLTFDLSPAIKAASEKLAKLREQPVERDLSPSTPPTSPGDTGMPSASPDVLEAQRKRFEELKVSVGTQR